jgi:RHS repeat-associated protein
VGNRLTRSDSTQGTTTYTYDADDRLLTETLAGKVTIYTYDDNGNLRSRDGGAKDQTSYNWDFENRLVGADITDSSGTHHMAYQYDADGNRVAQTVAGAVTRFLLDTNRPLARVIEEYAPSVGGLQASYVYGLSLIEQNRGGVPSFYQVDGLGSVRALTNAVGVVTDRYFYDAFGRLVSRSGTTTNFYLFTGEQFDPNLGFSYLRARYSDLATGRFISADPFAGNPDEPLTLHKYLYAAGNPVNNRDPSGLLLEQIFIGLGVAALLGAVAVGAYALRMSPPHFVQLKVALAAAQMRAQFEAETEGEFDYTEWFGPPTPDNQRIVRERWADIYQKSIDAGLSIVEAPPGECTNPRMYAYNEPPLRIYLCPLFWTYPRVGNGRRLSMAGGIIHELAHLAGAHGSEAYGEEDAKKLKPEDAVQNADSYRLQADI